MFECMRDDFECVSGLVWLGCLLRMIVTQKKALFSLARTNKTLKCMHFLKTLFFCVKYVREQSHVAGVSA